jgi:transketolase
MSNRCELANAIHAVRMDAVQQANSGHPVASPHAEPDKAHATVLAL